MKAVLPCFCVLSFEQALELETAAMVGGSWWFAFTNSSSGQFFKEERLSGGLVDKWISLDPY